MDKSFQKLQSGYMGSESNDPSLHQYSTSTKPMELVEPVSIGPVSQSLLVSHMQTGQVHVKTTNPGPQQFQLLNDQLRGMESFLRNAGPEQLSVPVKRKSSLEPTHNVNLEHSSMPNKRVAQMENRPRLQQVSVPNKRAFQMQHMSPAPESQLSPAANKKAVSMESIPTKAGQQRSSTPKNQAAPKNPPSKVQNESFESVRSKMRESLTASLALVSHPENKSSNAGQTSQSEAEQTSARNKENDQPAELVSTAGNAIGFDSGEAREILCPKENSFSNPTNENENALHKTSIPENTIETQASRLDGSEFQQNNVFSYEDMTIGEEFVKDELLQGNGLSWVLDSTIEVSEKNEIQSTEKHKPDPKVVDGSLGQKALQSPESLAFKIEAELFKFFGGVNKKYKEKGRSLLFNLKDPNNPGLRERVMSGQIPPERLCSMTAEELASEELAQWRMAKAEEFAQMVVLPDTEVDRRRFVKKTHKGEFQVIELDDNTSVDISNGSSFSQTQPNNNEKEEPSPNEADAVKDSNDTAGVKNNVEDKDVSYTLIIPSNEGSDLILDDALNNAEFLPPIISLDEFMESLDAEPPFENLSAEAKNSTVTTEKYYSGAGSEVKSSRLDPKDRADAIRKKNNKNTAGSIDGPSDLGSRDHPNDGHSPDTDTGLKSSDSNGGEKPSHSHVKSAMASPARALKVECVWEGLLQLNLMAMSSVTGVFISGEKARPKGWPSTLEIKGRVRLDAFEKFLQQLSLSRSRAVMVLHFDLKERRPEVERSNLSEAADSYAMDERVGIAEPASGVELYFCPPNKKTVELLGQVVQKDDFEALNTINNGLIGVLVWRKPQLTSSTALSPNSTSHYNKLSSKKQQHFTSRRKQDTTSTTTDVNYNNFSPQNTRLPQGGGGGGGGLPLTTSPQPQPDEDDDVPPGFGPPASRDEDLPEFNFSRGKNPSEPKSSARSSRGSGGLGFHQPSQIPYRPVDQMRELIHKYGQTRSDIPSRNLQEKGLSTQPWNEDDDDIPEWQPQVPQHQLPSPTPRPQYLLNQPPHFRAPRPVAESSVVPSQPQNGHPLLQQQGGWWGPPVQGNNSMQPSNIGRQVNGEHLYGTATQPRMSHSWRDNSSQSRGL